MAYKEDIIREITAVLVAAGLMLPTAADLPGISLGLAVVASAETVASGSVTVSVNDTAVDSSKITYNGNGTVTMAGMS